MTGSDQPSPSGCTIFFTGLPGAGKSTIASALLAELLRRGHRRVTLLDGDVARRHLSSDLGFSREHRDRHIRRLGFVAAEVTKLGGFAVCAAIAPYDAVRKEVRHMIGGGRFILVYVSTPIEVCETRDPKGLYAKVRAGQVTHFTGVSDPYEPPDDAELVIDTGEVTAGAAARRIVAYLEDMGHLTRPVRGGQARRSVSNLWRAWRQLGPLERRASLAAAIMIPVVAASLRIFNYRRVLRCAERARRGKGTLVETDVQQLVRATRRAARYGPYRGNCLSQSLTLFWLLRRHGLAAQLRLGARLVNGRLQAHAWVERAGVVLNDTADVTTRFVSFDTATRADSASWLLGEDSIP